MGNIGCVVYFNPSCDSLVPLNDGCVSTMVELYCEANKYDHGYPEEIKICSTFLNNAKLRTIQFHDKMTLRCAEEDNCPDILRGASLLYNPDGGEPYYAPVYCPLFSVPFGKDLTVEGLTFIDEFDDAPNAPSTENVVGFHIAEEEYSLGIKTSDKSKRGKKSRSDSRRRHVRTLESEVDQTTLDFLERAFARCDVDGDAELTTHEVMMCYPSLNQAAVHVAVNECDEDGSGSITLDEALICYPGIASRFTNH